MTSQPILLILGSGPRIGHSIAAQFASNNYTIVTASRSGIGSKTAEGYLSLKADFTKPESIPGIFDAIKAEYNTAPSVVIYNAAALTPPADKESVLSVSAEKVESDLRVNVVSPYVAAMQAVAGWERLGKNFKKTFIYTGNALNDIIVPMPMMLDLGMGKSASAYWIGVADALYAAKGYRFFYGDERQEDGKLKGMALDGPAHAEFYAQLANHGGSVPWQATFVKGKGYVSFK